MQLHNDRRKLFVNNKDKEAVQNFCGGGGTVSFSVKFIEKLVEISVSYGYTNIDASDF